MRDCETDRPASISSVTTHTFEFTFHDKHKYPHSNVRAGLILRICITHLSYSNGRLKNINMYCLTAQTGFYSDVSVVTACYKSSGLGSCHAWGVFVLFIYFV